MRKYKVGFDIGSDSVHAAVLDQENEVFYMPRSRMHFGNPADTLKEIYEKITAKVGFENILSVSFTGSVGKFIAEKLAAPFFYDTIAIPAGLNVIAPTADYVFHIGAKDSYFFVREKIKTSEGWKTFVPDHATGTKCGGGSGILITKQCRRFYEHMFPIKLDDNKRENRLKLQSQLEKIFIQASKEANQSEKFIDVGGRCGVVIQSDMIHLQNNGEQIRNILNGMFWRIIKNYKCDVLKTRVLESKKTAVATGGVFANKNLAKMLEEATGVKIEIPENFEKIGAIGAASKAGEKEVKFKLKELDLISQTEKEKVKMAPPLSSVLDKINIYDEPQRIAKKEDLVIYESFNSGDKINVFIGLDGGSTTTKAVVIEAKELKIIADICLYTSGRPLQSAQELFRQIRKNIGANINIRGLAYTGSSAAFYYKLFTDQKKNPNKQCLDVLKDEITCHALGVKHFNSKVDTIFELGGQDAKFTLFANDGNVKKAKMNLSCMAGTGQTMHNMVEMLGLDIKTSFHELALKAKRTPIVDETCGVFTEAGIAKLIAMGFNKKEIAAAIAYGFMGGYINKFVGNEEFGKYASAQGGPFNGKACLAALALHTGMEIHAFPRRQLFGALGAAIAVRNRLKRLEEEKVDFESKFRGLDLADAVFEKEVKACSQVVKNSCNARDCQLQVYKIDGDAIYSGGLCPKGNTETLSKKAPNYVEKYKAILSKHLDKFIVDLNKETEKERVLIPRSLSFLNEKGVFYSALYKSLGFDIAVSPESDDEISALGINYAHSETCYPVKLAHGHAAYLKKYLRKGKDKILFANVIASEEEMYKFCPYVAAAGFLVKDALLLSNEDVLLPVIHFNNSVYKLEEYLEKDLRRVFGNKFSRQKIRTAIFSAQKAEEEFLNEIYLTGREIIERLKEKDEKIFIGIGRGYTVLDNKASSKVHELFANYGLHFVPALFLEGIDCEVDKIVENMYWLQGRKMIEHTLITAMDPLLYPVRETNFNCGADSFILYHEANIINKAKKPYLVLQTDGHNSNAQFGTRTLANWEVVKKHKPLKTKIEDYVRKFPMARLEERIIGVPYMGDGSNVIAAALRALGFESEVISTQTQRAQSLAKVFVTTNTCRPFFFQVGDTLAWLYALKEKGIDPNQKAAVFQPKARGPCRFGQYSAMLRKFFDENGFIEVPVINPDGSKDYNDIPISKKKLMKLLMLCLKGFFGSDILYDALLRTRPYEKEKESAEKKYEELRQKLYRLVENNPGMKEFTTFMKNACREFEKLVDFKKERKPLVIMNGEIFMRCHPKANQNSIKLLEKYGLEVMVATPSQWVEYVNKCAIRHYKKSKEWKKLITALIKKEYIKIVSKKMFKPFADYLKGRESHDPEHVIDYVQKNLVYERLISGESPLSIGEAYMFAHGKMREICGIYHVGPFGCMHETTATSKIEAIIQEKRNLSQKMEEKIIPFMDGVFGDSELPNLEAEIAAFAEKCYLKQRLNSKKH